MIKDQFGHSGVYRRMLQTAAEVWNVKEADLTSLDPAFNLLLNATAKEIEKVGQELKSAEARILKRLAKQLLPYEAQSVMPAHSVLHFTPSEMVQLSGYEEFHFEKRWHNKDKFNRIETKVITFSPAARVALYPHRILYRIEKGKVSYIHGLDLDSLDVSSPVTNSKTVVLAIQGSVAQGVSLYFDWMAESEKRDLFSLLDKVRVTTLDGSPLKVKRGLEGRQSNSAHFLDQLNILKQTDDMVVNFYQNRFLQVDLQDIAPNALHDAIPHAYQQLVQELNNPDECSWIVLHFPDELGDRYTHEATILVNCFPVVNRKFEKQVIRLQPDLNIKKLSFEGAFFAIERVESAAGSAFQEVRTIAADVNRPGTYSLRRGNVGRLDDREATEFLSYIVDLIGEERQAFAAAEASSTGEDLKIIEQALKRVEKRVDAAGLHNTRPYIMITPFKEYENAYIYYWSTDAAFANGIAKGSSLECRLPGISVDGKGLLLSDSIGGEDELSDARLIAKYRNALLTKDVIVTRADIISNCFAMGEGYVQAVDVNKEVIASHLGKQGLMQVLMVRIAFDPVLTETSKKDYLLQRLETHLLARSNFSIPINVKEIHD